MSDEQDKEQTQEKPKTQYASFDAFVEGLDEPLKELYNSHISGLKNALEGEKENRRKLSEQVKALAPKVEKGSELEQKLAETVKQLEEMEQRSKEANRRAYFAEDAIRPGVGCTNVRVAYALAVSENLFDAEDKPKWAELKKLAPELFKVTRLTDAGNHSSSVANDINAAIRKAAGI